MELVQELQKVQACQPVQNRIYWSTETETAVQELGKELKIEDNFVNIGPIGLVPISCCSDCRQLSADTKNTKLR